MKKILILTVALVCLAVFAFVGCQGGQGKGAAGGVRTTAKRADALKGESITPKDFPAEVMPGIKDIGAVPKKKYKIAFSNGDIGQRVAPHLLGGHGGLCQAVQGALRHRVHRGQRRQQHHQAAAGLHQPDRAETGHPHRVPQRGRAR